MNYFKTLFGLAIFSILVLVSCNKDEEEEKVSNNNVTEDVSARVLSSSLSYDSYGITAVLNYIACEGKEMVDEIECDGEKNSSDKISYATPNDKINTTYDYSQTCSKICSPEIKLHYSTLAKHITKGGYFETDNDIKLNGDLSGIDEDSEYFYFDGKYSLDGVWEDLATKLKLDVVINFNTINSIHILKSENPDQIRVTSGKLKFTIKAGLVNSFASADIEGTITYLSELEARIDFDDGGSYLVDLKTGTVEDIK